MLGIGEWESGRVGEWESGRVGEWESGRVGEWESGRVGEWESGRVGGYAKGVESLSPGLAALGLPWVAAEDGAYPERVVESRIAGDRSYASYGTYSGARGIAGQIARQQARASEDHGRRGFHAPAPNSQHQIS